MHLCIASFKECWQDEHGAWHSYGGFPAQMTALASLFARVTLVIVRGHPRAGGLPLPTEARVIPLRRPAGAGLRRKLSVLLGLPNYGGTIAREFRHADAAHLPLPGDIPLLGLLIALAQRKPVLARYGGSWVPNSQTTMANRLTRGLMRRFAGGRNVMLATGEGDRPPAPGVAWIFSTAFTARELACIEPRCSRSLGSPPSLVYAGRLSPEKGVMFLLDALAELQARGMSPLPRLTVAGDGPQRSVLELRARALPTGAVTFAGQVDRTLLGRLMSAADLAVQPSLSEGYSKAWLDAMAHGLPVVASDVGAAAAVVGGDGMRGWLVPPGNAMALADRLEEVLTTAVDWPGLRHRCRAFVEGRTLEAWADQIARHCEAAWGRRLHDVR